MSTLTAERIAEIETRHKARVEFFSENPPRFYTPGYQAHCDRGALLSERGDTKAARNSHDALVTAAAQIFADGIELGGNGVFVSRKAYDALRAALAMASIEGGL